MVLLTADSIWEKCYKMVGKSDSPMACGCLRTFNLTQPSVPHVSQIHLRVSVFSSPLVGLLLNVSLSTTESLHLLGYHLFPPIILCAFHYKEPKRRHLHHSGLWFLAPLSVLRIGTYSSAPFSARSCINDRSQANSFPLDLRIVYMWRRKAMQLLPHSIKSASEILSQGKQWKQPACQPPPRYTLGRFCNE